MEDENNNIASNIIFKAAVLKMGSYFYFDTVARSFSDEGLRVIIMKLR